MARASVDLSPYAPIVQQAMVAFAQDSGYVEQMARSAEAILRKRETWSLRTELRTAEQLARLKCHQDQKPCDAVSPCGFGDCRYADPPIEVPLVISTKGKQRRPALEVAYPSYDRELVVQSVLASRIVA